MGGKGARIDGRKGSQDRWEERDLG